MHGGRAAWPLLALLLATMPVAHAAPPTPTGWVVTRSAPGPAPLEATLTARMRSSGATVALFSMTGPPGRRKVGGGVDGLFMTFGVDGWARVHADGRSTPECAAVTCTNPAPSENQFVFHSNGRPIASSVFIAAWEADVTLALPDGWRATRWTPAMRVAQPDDAGGWGVRVVHGTFGRFEGSIELPGGRYGSKAWGALPCGRDGEGSGEFTGGRRHQPLACPGDSRGSDWATGPTRWRLAGTAQGLDATVNILVVVDFPR